MGCYIKWLGEGRMEMVVIRANFYELANMITLTYINHLTTFPITTIIVNVRLVSISH